MIRTSLAIALVAASLSAMLGTGPASAGPVLDRIKSAGKLTLGYREDAIPFSYKNEQGQAAGYTVEICQALAEDLKAGVGAADLPIEWVPVTIDDRFQAVAAGKVDLVCGATSVTLSRRKEVSFSLPVFIGGTGVMLRTDAPVQLRQVLNGEPTGPIWRGSPALLLQKKTFAVVKDTTSADLLKNRLRKLQITANITEVESYDAGLAALLDRSADVLVGDRPILVEAAQKSAQAADLEVIGRTFGNAPIALPLDRNDEDFRLAVDTALSKLYRSDRFGDIYRKWFGEPTEETLELFQAAALQD
jgi:polar amino acid transport system substrate-binding protein